MEKIVLDIQLDAKDLWRFSMHHANKGFQGIFNVAFSILWMILFIVDFAKMDVAKRLLFLLLALTFSVIQPAILYLKSMKQAKSDTIKKGIRMSFSEEGIEVTQGEASGMLTWEEMYKTKFLKEMVILYSTSMRGYLIPKRFWGEEKERLFTLLKSKTSH